jgi:hypothetical protein
MLGATTLSIMTLSIMTLSIITFSLMGLFATLSINDTRITINFQYAECRVLFIVILIIIILNVIMLTVSAPYFEAKIGKETCVWLV